MRKILTIFIIFILVPGIASLAKAADIDSSGDSNATADSKDRHMVRSNNGTIVVVYGKSDDIVARKSADDGANWTKLNGSAGYTTIAFSDGYSGQKVSVCLDSSDNIYMAYLDSQVIYFRKLTYSGGSWTLEDQRTVDNSGYEAENPSIVREDSGKVWVAYGYEDNSGNGWLRAAYATDPYSSWSYTNIVSAQSGVSASELQPALVLRSASPFVVFNDQRSIQGGDMKSAYWDGDSWESAGQAAPNDSWGNGFSVTTVGTDVHLVYNESGAGIYHRYYNGSWNAGGTLSSVSNDSWASLTTDNTSLWCFISSNVATNQYNIRYKKRSGGTWDASWTAITTDNANNRYSTTPLSTSEYIPLAWTVSTSPYPVKFNKSVTLPRTYTWDGGGDGVSWANANNWDLNDGYPDDKNDRARILTGSASISTPGTALIIGELELGSSYSGTLTLGAALTLDASGPWAGNLSIGANATLNLAGKNLTIGGTFSNNGTLKLKGDEAVSKTPNPNSTVEYTATSDSRAIKNWTYNHLKINGSGGTFTMGAGEILTGNLTVSAGTFDVNNQTLTINGNTTINGGTMKTGTGVVTFGNASGDSVNISSGELQIESDNTNTDIIVNAGTWTNSGGIIRYNAGTSVSTTLRSALSPYYNLTVNSTGSTYTLDGAINVNNNLTVTSGTFNTHSTGNYAVSVNVNVDIDGIFTANGSTITVAGNWDSSGGTFNYNTSTVDLTGTGNLKTPTNGSGTERFYNLKVAAQDKTTTLLSHVAVADTLTIGNGELTDGASSFYVTLKKNSGTPLSLGNATITISRIVYRPSNGTVTVTGGNYGTLDYLELFPTDSNATFNLGGDVTVSGAFWLVAPAGKTNVVCDTQDSNITATRLLIGDDTANGSTILNCKTSTINIGTGGVDMANNGGSHTLNLSSATITCEGNWELADGTGSIAQDPGTSIVTLEGSSGTQTVKSNSQSFYNLKIENTGTSVQLQDAADIDGGLIVTTGTLALNNYDITISSDVSISGSGSLTCSSGEQITVGGNWSASSGATFTAASSTTTFNGSGSFNILSSGTTFYNLVFNNSGGTWTLTDALYVDNDFTQLNGTFDTNSSGNYPLTIGDDITISGGTFYARVSTITLTGSNTDGSADWDSDGGTFTYGTSTVDLKETGTVKGSGATSYNKPFYNLTCAYPGKTTTIITWIGVHGILSVKGGTLTTSGSYRIYLHKSSCTPIDIVNDPTISVYRLLFNGSQNVPEYNYGSILGVWSSGEVTQLGNVTCNALRVDGDNFADRSPTWNTDSHSLTINGGLLVGGTSGSPTGTHTFTANGSTITITGNVTLNHPNAYLNLNTSNMSVAGNWTITNGSVNPGTSTVTFDGTGDSTLTGSTTFYVLVSTTTNKNVKVSSDTVIGVTNHLNFENITLRSTLNGATWYLNLTGTQDVSGVDARDSNASGSTDTIIAFTSTDSGNNTKWDFGPPEAITDLTGECDSQTGDVTLYWSTPGDDYNWQNTLVDGSKYIIDHSSYSIAWSTSTYDVEISTSGVAPHTEVSHTVTGLQQNTTWYFRIWTADEIPLWSGLSNGATVWVEVIVASVTVSAYTDGTPDVPPTYVYTNTPDNCLGTFRFYGGGTISSMTITEYGTCDADDDLSSVKLYKDNGNGNWEPAQDTLLDSTNFDANDKATFSGFSLAGSTYCYVHVVLTVQSVPDSGYTIGIELHQNDIVCTSTTTAASWPVQLGTSMIIGESASPSYSSFESQNSTGTWISASEWNDDLTPNTRVQILDTGAGLRIGSQEVAPDTHTVLLLHLNGDTTDYSGHGNNGTRYGDVGWISTDTWRTGVDIEDILDFDGQDDYVEISNPGSVLDGKNLTVSAWIYHIRSGDSYQRIVDRVYNGQFAFFIQPFAVGNYSAGELTWALSTVGGDKDYSEAAVIVPEETWTHVVLTYDGSDARIYVNGSLEDTYGTGISGGLSNSTDNIRIGQRVDVGDSRYFNGLIDEVRILDRALSADEVAAEYYSGLFKYSTNGGGTWNPTNAWSTGTVTGGNGSTTYQTIYASNVPFNQYSETENQIKFLISDTNGNIAYSSEYIVKIGSITVSAYTEGDPDVPPTYVYTNTPDNCLGTFRFYGGGTISSMTITEYGTCDADDDLSSVKLYKDNGNGNWEPAQDTLLDSTNFDANDKATFSGFSLAGSTYCYVHVVLTVQSVPNSGNTIGIKLYQDDIVCTSTTTAASWPVQLGTSMIIGESASPSYSSFESQNLNDDWITEQDWNDDLTPNTRVQVLDTGSGLRIGSQDVAPDTHTVLLLHLKLNDTTDYSGHNNHGTGYGGVGWISTDTWKTGGNKEDILYFAGDNDYVSIDDDDSLDMGTHDFTLVGWIKTSSASTGYVIAKSNNTNQLYGVYINSDGYVIGIIRYDNVVASTADGATVNDDQWHHIAVVFDRSGTMSRYIDGTNSGTNDDISGQSGNIDNDIDVTIGARTGGVYFNGLIDEVRILDRVLTADEIAADYYSGLFKYSTNGGGTWNPTNAWSTGTVTGGNGSTGYETIHASNVPFNQYSGTENKIKFLISDTNGNIAESFEYIVMIGSITVSAYTAGTPDVPPSTVGQGTTGNCLGTFKFAGAGTISSMTITQYGTCDAEGELENVKLFEDNGNGDWNSGDDTTQLGSTTTFNASNKATFSSLSLEAGTTTYVHVVLDVKSTAQVDNTIGIELYQNDIVCTSTTTAASWPVQLGTSTIKDITPPAAITDLTGLCDSGTGYVTLYWSTPGDDGWNNTLADGSEYIIDCSSYSIQWSTSTYDVEIATFGVTPYTPVSHTVTGLQQDTTWYFRIWTADEVSNWSGLSNGATVWVTVVGTHTYTWTDGAEDGDWTNSNNWTGATGYPDDADDKAVINTSTRTINTPASALTIGELVLGGSYSGTLTLGGALTLDDAGGWNGDLTIDAGTLDVSGSNHQINIDGNWSNSGTFTAQSGTVTFSGTGSKTLSGTMTGTSAFYNLYFDNASGTWTLYSDLKVTNVLNIDAGELDANYKTIELAGSGTPFLVSGTFIPSGSTVKYTSPDDTNITAANYYHLDLIDPPLETRNQKPVTSDQKELLQNLERLKIKEIEPDKFSFKSLSGDLIEIGEERHSPPQPYLKLNRWDGEVSLKVDIPYAIDGQKSLANNRLSWVNHRYDVDFYPKSPQEIIETIQGKDYIFRINEEGGVEFDITLKEKPESNVFTFPIETQGLKFYYQPPLHPEHPTWVDEDGDGKADSFRPENTVGSYAVYHETQDKFFKTKEEAEKYKCGKAFHIYRPKVYDDEGKETWGKLNINEQAGVLTVTIDQGWLDKAVYPVVIDPNFGNENTGSITIGPQPNRLYGSIFTSPANAESANSMTIYSRKVPDGPAHLKAVLALGSNLNIVTNGVGNGVEILPQDYSYHWITSNFSTPPALSGSTDYLLSAVYDATCNLMADSGDPDQGLIDFTNSYASPTNPTDGATTTHKYTIYCTYTAAYAIYTLLSGTFDIDGNLTIGNSSDTMEVTADTNDPTIDLEGNFNITANSTFTASDTASFNVGGNWSNSGTFTHSTGTVTLDGSSGTQTVTSGGDSFYHLEIDNTGTSVQLEDDLDVNGNLTISAGTLDVSGSNYQINIDGNWSNSGTFTAQSSTVTFSGTGSKTLSGTMTGTSAFYNLYFNNASGTWTLNNDLEVTNVLNIGAGELDANYKTIELAGSGTPFLVSGTFIPSGSTVKYTSPDDTNITAANYYHLELIDPPLETRNQKPVISNQKELLQNLEKLSIKEIEPDKFSFKSLSGDLIEIGEERHSPPQPYLKLNRWDGEVSLKVDIPYAIDGQKSLTNNRLSWVNHRYDVDFYPKEPEEIKELGPDGKYHTFTINEEGGVEFDLTLKERPESNVFTFPIQTQGLKFYYQPPLHPEHPTWADRDGDGKPDSFRPENTVGSYAVYHETQDKFFKTKEEAEKYKFGKAFHIYRPRVYDVEGKETWGKLNINERAGILTVTIDQGWLDNAVYPVVIDPNFGYESNGGSFSSTGANCIYGGLYLAGNSGIAQSITFWPYYWGSGTKIKAALYEDGDSVTSGAGGTFKSPGTEEKNDGAPDGTLTTFDFTNGPSITSGKSYYIVFWNDVATGFSYDSIAGEVLVGGWSAAYGDWPSSYDGNYDFADYRTAIYCTYTPAAGATYTLLSGTFDIDGNFTVGNSTDTMEVTADTNDPTIDLEGYLNITASSTFTASDTASFNVGGNWSNSGTFTHSTGTVTLDGSSGTQTVTSGGQSFYNLVINNTGTSVQLEDDLDVNGNLTISAGTLDTKSGENNPINIAGNWTREGGTFECRQSTVTFDNASSTSTLTGSTTFYGLVSTASGKNVKVSSDTVIGVTGHLNFENITLRSTLNGATWYLNLSGSGTQDVSGVDVQDSNASGGSTIYAMGASTDSGNNTNWVFSGAGLTLTWTGVVNSTFSVAGNWDPQFSPTPTSNIIIPNTATKPKLEANTSINGLNINEGSARLELNGYDLTISSYVTLAGTMTCTGTEQITAGGGWDATGGYFDAAQSTVTFNAPSGTKNILSSGTTFYNLVFNGSGGWTLQDDLFCTNISVLDGTLTDSGRIVTVNGNINIADVGSQTLNSTGTWIQSANGNISNPYDWTNAFSVLQIDDGVTSKRNGTTRTRKLILGTNAILQGLSSVILQFPTVNDFIDMGSDSNITGGAVSIVPYWDGLTKTQKAISVSAPVYIGWTSSATIQMTGNWTTGNLTIHGASSSTSETSAALLDTNGNNLTVNGDLTLGWSTSGHFGKILFSTGTHSITDNVGVGSSGDTHGYFDLGSADTSIRGNCNFTRATVTPGTSTVTLNGSSGTQTVTSDSESFYHLVINNTGTSVQLEDDLDVNGNLTISAGTLDTKSGENNPINIAGNWTFEGDAFECNSSTVTFDNASSTSTLTGSTTFYGLVSTASTKKVKVSSDTVIGVTGYLNFEDITLRSTLNGATWYLNLSGSGTQDVSGVNVRDSNASGGDTIIDFDCPEIAGCYYGNNTNWDFGPPGAITDLSGQCDSGTGEVTLYWSTPGDDEWTGTLVEGVDGSKYRIDYSSYSIAWSTNTFDVDIPTHSVTPYTPVSHTITGLTGDTTWYFRIWTADEIPLWSGLSNGCTVWVNPIISVSISTDTYNFGEVPLGQSTHTVSVITVTNDGNLNETYSLQISSVTLYDDSPSLWKSTNTTTGHNRFIFYAIFHAVQVSTSNFDSDDYVIDENRTSTADWFSDNDGGGDKQTGINVPKGDDRKLWFRLDMPTSTTTGKEEKITVTITAGPE